MISIRNYHKDDSALHMNGYHILPWLPYQSMHSFIIQDVVYISILMYCINMDKLIISERGHSNYNTYTETKR